MAGKKTTPSRRHPRRYPEDAIDPDQKFLIELLKRIDRLESEDHDHVEWTDVEELINGLQKRKTALLGEIVALESELYKSLKLLGDINNRNIHEYFYESSRLRATVENLVLENRQLRTALEHGDSSGSAIKPGTVISPWASEKTDLAQEVGRLREIIRDELWPRLQVEASSEPNRNLLSNLIPIQFFLDTDDDHTLEKVKNVLDGLLESAEGEWIFEGVPERGSWLQRLIARLRGEISPNQLGEMVREILPALLDGTEEKNYDPFVLERIAGPLSELLQSLDNIPTGVIQIGNTIIVKSRDAKNEPRITVRLLTKTELLALASGEETIQSIAAIKATSANPVEDDVDDTAS